MVAHSSVVAHNRTLVTMLVALRVAQSYQEVQRLPQGRSHQAPSALLSMGLLWRLHRGLVAFRQPHSLKC